MLGDPLAGFRGGGKSKKRGFCSWKVGFFNITHPPTHPPHQQADKFKAAGADRILCIAPNDAFVTQAWAASIDGASGGAVQVLADKDNALAAAWGVVLDAEAKLGTKRIKRLSAVLKDGAVAAINVEPDGGGATCSLADPTLDVLKQVAAA